LEEQTFFLLKKEEQNNEFSRSKVENEGKCTLAAVVLKLLTAYTLQHKVLIRALYLTVYIFKIIFLKFGPIIIFNISGKPVQIIL
jgi:hypothetical protein